MTTATIFDGLSDDALHILNHPEAYADRTWMIADVFLILKARRGQPVTQDRLARLRPHYDIVNDEFEAVDAAVRRVKAAVQDKMARMGTLPAHL